MIERNIETGEVIRQEQPTAAHEIVLRAQQIAGLMQLYQFIKAANVGVGEKVGTQIHMQLLDAQRTTLFVNSKLLEATLMAEFQRLGGELEDAGISMEQMMEQADTGFDKVYNQQSK